MTTTVPILEALRRKLGAASVRVVAQNQPLPAPRGLFGRRRLHVLTADVPGTPDRLICLLSRAPAPDDVRAANEAARKLCGSHAPRLPERLGAAELASALAAPDADRGPRLLRAALTLAASRAGGLVTLTPEPRSWTHGPGVPVLKRAAARAGEGEAGTLEVGDRRFLALPLVAGGVLVGGLALEDVTLDQTLQDFAACVAAAVAPHQPAPEPVPVAGDLQAALRAAGVPAIAVDAHGRLLAASPEAEALFGLLIDFDQGQPIAGRLRCPAAEQALTGGPVPDRIALGERTFQTRPAELPSGGRLLVLRDRTDDEALERLRDDLVSAVAHELRTPIAAVRGLIQLLQLRGDALDAGKRTALLGDGEREMARLERLVEDLLLTARISAGGIVPQPAHVELRPIADEVAAQLLMKYPGVRFVVEGEAVAWADPALARHAIWHLADNAAKFGPPDGEVRLLVKATDAEAEVEVVDAGPGIFSGDLPNLFRRFAQIDGSATRRHGGAGQGLFLVKAVIDAQAGRVWVRSKLGIGSTFGFALTRGE